MAKYDVFISYSRKDYMQNSKVIPGNIVTKIKKLLSESGYTYWFDEDNEYVGDTFTTIITEAIKDSEVFLYISTANANASEWTNHEIAVAKHLKKKTIPFRVDESEYDTSVLMYLAPLDYIDYYANHKLAMKQLVSSLESYFSSLKEPETEKVEKPDVNEDEAYMNKWHWGAFLVPQFWIPANMINWKQLSSKDTKWIATGVVSLLLAFLGGGYGILLLLLFGVYLGIKGRRMAWNARPWKSIDSFKKAQYQWSVWAIVLNVVSFLISYTATIMSM